MKDNSTKKYSQEDIDYINQNIEKQTIAEMAAHLGRGKSALASKVSEMRKSHQLRESQYIYRYTLLRRLGYEPGGNQEYNIAWIEKRGLPIHPIAKSKKIYQVVYLHEFWEWAYHNQHALDFSRFERGALGSEPSWVQTKRERDKAHRAAFHYFEPWSEDEDIRLAELILSQKYNYKEISQLMHRSEGSIKKRKQKLGISEKINRTGGSKWSHKEIDLLFTMISQGYRYENIADALDRSVKAVRGKVMKLTGTENLDKAKAAIAGFDTALV